MGDLKAALVWCESVLALSLSLFSYIRRYMWVRVLKEKQRKRVEMGWYWGECWLARGFSQRRFTMDGTI